MEEMVKLSPTSYVEPHRGKYWYHYMIGEFWFMYEITKEEYDRIVKENTYENHKS